MYIAPDNSHILISDGVSIMRISGEDYKIESQTELHDRNNAFAVAFDPSGKRLVVGDTYKLVIYSTETFQKTSELEWEIDVPIKFKFDPAGNYLVVDGRGRVTQFDWKKKRVVKKYPTGSSGRNNLVAVSQDGQHLALLDKNRQDFRVFKTPQK